MTCDEARELFSARADDALTPDERGGLDAHLAGCPDCRRELVRFEGTVRLLRAVAPARAPVGFVERVLAAAPMPWYARWWGRLCRPLVWARPLEATAVVLVAVAAVYLYERTPELRQAPTPVPSYPVASQAAREPVPVPPPRASTGPPASPRAKESSKESSFERLFHAEHAAPAPERMATAPAPTESRERQAAVRDEAAKRAPAPSGPATLAAKAEGRADAVGRLAVADRSEAERALAALLARLGAAEVGRRAEPGVLVVEIVVPASAYPELLEGLGRIGRWEAQPAAAELPARVRLVLRISD
ncbi:MAG TPA: zf-HC2 domain-containing protein [Methylomirabilota bacterium]|nr:zf-HC2 domain-containing protein [Methylomirabilota bacterium]